MPKFCIQVGDQWFDGFAYRHPGTQPVGIKFAQLDRRRCIIIPRSDLDEIVADLKALGSQEVTCYSVRAWKTIG